jgi:hypothetical protein
VGLPWLFRCVDTYYRQGVSSAKDIFKTAGSFAACRLLIRRPLCRQLILTTDSQ